MPSLVLQTWVIWGQKNNKIILKVTRKCKEDKEHTIQNLECI